MKYEITVLQSPHIIVYLSLIIRQICNTFYMICITNAIAVSYQLKAQLMSHNMSSNWLIAEILIVFGIWISDIDSIVFKIQIGYKIQI